MRRLRLLAAAGIPAGSYLLFVFHYSVNVPYADDWNLIPLVDAALRGRLTMTSLWEQYGDTRIFFPKLFFLFFAWVDHFNTRHIIVFSALLFVVSYLLLLPLFRSYLARELTFWPVFVLGVVWFSLIDVQNSLWSFQLAWYLAVFFLVAMISLLLSPTRNRSIFFGLGLLSAIVGSYSIVQGFVLWPIGLICVLWPSPWRRRTFYEAAGWISAAVLATVIYRNGLDTANSQCITRTCTAGYGLSHPWLLVRYVVLLMGNVVPTSYFTAHPDLVLHELIGTLVAVAAIFVAVQSVRERRIQRSPLPLLLVVFGISFDALIAIARFNSDFGGGPPGALNNNRYTMANLVLLAGIVIYAWAHLPFPGGAHAAIDRRRPLAVFGLVTVSSLLVIQFVVGTQFGITKGRAWHQTVQTDARVVANFYGGVSDATRQCYAAIAVIPPEYPEQAWDNVRPLREMLVGRQLSVFQPSTLDRYLRMGPPTRKAIVDAWTFAAVPAGDLGPGCP